MTLVKLIEGEVLNNHLLHFVLERMISEPDKRPMEIIVENDWRQITDEEEIEKLCREVLEANPKLVEEFKAGKQKVFQAIVGHVHKLSKRKANMRLAVQKLKDMLK